MIFGNQPMSEFKARQLGALELAYIGDSVYECCVRGQLLLAGGGRMKALHRAAVSRVRVVPGGGANSHRALAYRRGGGRMPPRAQRAVRLNAQARRSRRLSRGDGV